MIILHKFNDFSLALLSAASIKRSGHSFGSTDATHPRSDRLIPASPTFCNISVDARSAAPSSHRAWMELNSSPSI
jgi:hypothetical protein